jgi:maltooligosyltrehalose trehalohydrolase
VPPGEGGYGLDSLWNDDFHHAALVALNGRREGYYSDYRGQAGEFVALAKYGFLYQGQYSARLKRARGTLAFDLPASRFVNYLQNHDQIAHSATGRRGHQFANPACWRAMTAYLLLSAGIPLLFQGQEFGASSPFLYFADHQGELAEQVKKGRGEFLAQFSSLASPRIQALLDDPRDPRTFERCVLDHCERERRPEVVALHRDLIALRRDILDGSRRLESAVLGRDAWIVRYFGPERGDVLLIVCLGSDRVLDTIAEPLLAPTSRRCWSLVWSSEDRIYGGSGVPDPVAGSNWHFPGHAAIVLASD